jgi:hypothetical protein
VLLVGGAAAVFALAGSPARAIPLTTTSCGYGGGTQKNFAAQGCGPGTKPHLPPGQDSTPPDILGDLPELQVEATGPDGATVDYGNPTGYDNQDGDIPVDCVPPPGSKFPLGKTLVTCSAQDSAGNPARRTFTVDVEDKTPPTLTLPGNLVVHSWFRTGRKVSFSIGAEDAVDGPVAVTCSPPPGSFLPTGLRIKVTCTATDSRGNKAVGSFFITVVFGR